MINKTVSVLYESKHPALTSRHWFGKEDGLIRKDEMLSAGDRVREMVVDEVAINPKVANDLFHFTPPPRAKVIDKTDTLFKAIEEDKRRYQMFIEQKRKKESEREKDGKEKGSGLDSMDFSYNSLAVWELTKMARLARLRKITNPHHKETIHDSGYPQKEEKGQRELTK